MQRGHLQGLAPVVEVQEADRALLDVRIRAGEGGQHLSVLCM